MGLCAGSGGDLVSAALAQGADAFVTGEMRHHDALAAAAKGLTVICTLHSNRCWARSDMRCAAKAACSTYAAVVPVVRWPLNGSHPVQGTSVLFTRLLCPQWLCFSCSERGAMEPYAMMIRKAAPGLDVRVSTRDRDPFSFQ